VLRCPPGSGLLAALLAARSAPDLRIKRQARPYSKPSEFVRYFDLARLFQLDLCGAVPRRASALLLALLLVQRGLFVPNYLRTLRNGCGASSERVLTGAWAGGGAGS
jgi:hypothetical protein